MTTITTIQITPAMRKWCRALNNGDDVYGWLKLRESSPGVAADGRLAVSIGNPSNMMVDKLEEGGYIEWRRRPLGDLFQFSVRLTAAGKALAERKK